MTINELKEQFAIECTTLDEKGYTIVKGTPIDIINWIADKFGLSNNVNYLNSDTFQISVRTSDYRGDHSSDVDVALNISSEMTIGNLISKVFHSTEIRSFDKLHDVIHIRVCN